MGYSPQKTPFDLADFLSKPGTPKTRKWNRYSQRATPAPAAAKAETVVAEAADKP
ncbi:hypothetical protein [Pseudorhodobacter sp. MZDSW-24AT]|uniref:hypothetical protein n=1 Tax=Pseudorhodobacter sp. MZDSW-24AT TaxID=2052957 RepID=UPI0012FDC4A9|nr:hypothetical protein [Pseudorhodobacter sp. MZDSW-24AT]